MSTGAFVRIKCNGTWENLEIDQMTDAEFDSFAQEQPEDVGWKWAKFLAAWIRDNVTTETPS